MGGTTWGPFTDDKSLVGLKLRRGQLEERLCLQRHCEPRAGTEGSLDATPVSLFTCVAAAGPALAATGLRLTERLSSLTRADRRPDGVLIFWNLSEA